MTSKSAATIQHDSASLQSEETSDALRRRLTTAEADAHQLMQQLEEMGFGGGFNGESMKGGFIHSTNYNDLHIKNKENCNTDYGTKQSSHHSYNQEKAKDTYVQLQQNPASFSISCKNQSNKGLKHRLVSPNSARDFVKPGSLNVRETSISKSYAPKYLVSFENGSKKQSRSDILEEKADHQELEQELRLRRLESQLEEELQYEMDGKKKFKQEAEKLQGHLDDATTANAELEMKIEELTLAKQKLQRRMSELKEEASRESSLRFSLEESHATLLSRLQDMESVIESLRMECKNHSTSSNGLKAEVEKLKDEVTQETLKRQKAEESCNALNTEKDRLLINANNAHSENQRVFHDLTCLQGQYAELIKQLEQTQILVDGLSTSKKALDEEGICLQNRVQILTSDNDKLKILYEETKKSETVMAAQKSAVDEDLIYQKSEKEKLTKENIEKKQKIDNLEQELKSMKLNLTQKNLEFASAADSLELELAGFKNQLDAMEREKQEVLKDKESLLKEVNQTVDTLMSERSRLQTELQASCVEMESLRMTCSQLELDKAQLLERLDGIQQQQTTQRKVEAALNEMMEQKNKLAYENGKLLSTVDQLHQELSEVRKEQVDGIQLRKLIESLQAKYTKSQRVISEYKISLQRLEGQCRISMEDLEQKDHQLKMAQDRRDDAERETEKLLAQLEVLKERQQHKTARYEKNMEEAKSVNKEITGTLEAVMTSHTQLQNIVENLQVELGKRDSQIGQLKNSRTKEQNKMKLEVKKYEDKIETLKQQLKKYRERTGEKKVQEVSEILKQSENLSSRNQDLMKANSELRQKMVDIEKEKDEMKRRLSGQRHKLQYLHKAKKQLEENMNKMKAVHEDIEGLEQVREEYMQKNKDQGETIGIFIQQVASLQDEVKQLVTIHSKTQHLLKLKEEALEKERRIQDEIRQRYTECKKREEELSKKTQSSDDKLKEVHSESLEISKHLEEAHDWFKGKFDKLQTRLTASREIQAKLEMENIDQRKYLELEKSKAQNAAEKAREMIQNSRQTISQLADYAKMADVETRKNLSQNQTGLYQQYGHPN